VGGLPDGGGQLGDAIDRPVARFGQDVEETGGKNVATGDEGVRGRNGPVPVLTF